MELEESDAELERLQLTLNELLEDVREEGHFAENVVQEMWMPVSVILTRSAWCLGDWRLSQRQRWQIELVQKKAQILSDFIQEVSFLSLIHISEPTRRTPISYAVFCLKKKKIQTRMPSSY